MTASLITTKIRCRCLVPVCVDDPGARVTCGGRALVTADKGNDPPRTGRGLSQAWVRGPVVHRLALHPCSERRHRDGYRGHRGPHRYRASARSEHWATALSRDGRKVLDRALPNGEDRLREVYQRLQAKGQVLVVVDQPATIRGPGRGGGPGHGHHRGLPARTVHETHRRPDAGQRQDRRQGRCRHHRRGQDHAPHPESRQRLRRGRRGAEHAHWFRPGPGPPGQPDQGPHPGPAAQPRPRPALEAVVGPWPGARRRPGGPSPPGPPQPT